MCRELWGAQFIAATMAGSAGDQLFCLVNKVPHHLLQGANPVLNLAISLMVVLSGHPDLNIEGLHDLRPKPRGNVRVLVQNDT